VLRTLSKILFVSIALLLSGCASGKFKERQEQREKVSATSGMFCEFVSGDVFPDLDVELNLRMAQRCDSNKNFTLANYKNSSEQNGIIYCCANGGGRTEKSSIVVPAKTVVPAKAGTKSDNKSNSSADEIAD
jgi:hypothetical protein